MVTIFVTAHGGKMTVSSTFESGTKFRFTIPAICGKPVWKRIAFLADNVFLLEAWKEKLKDAVDVFSSPEAFLQEIHRDNSPVYSVVITDQHFETSSLRGDDVAQEIRAKSLPAPAMCEFIMIEFTMHEPVC